MHLMLIRDTGDMGEEPDLVMSSLGTTNAVGCAISRVW